MGSAPLIKLENRGASVLLDTHAWFWLTTDDPKLNLAARREIEKAHTAQSIFMSSISLWELALKHSRGKLELDRPIRPWLRQALKTSETRLISMDVEIAAACAELPEAFHGDPADRIIAATARSEGLRLVTHDKKLLALAKQGFFQAIAT